MFDFRSDLSGHYRLGPWWCTKLICQPKSGSQTEKEEEERKRKLKFKKLEERTWGKKKAEINKI